MLSIGVFPDAKAFPFLVATHDCWVLPRKYGPVGVLKRFGGTGAFDGFLGELTERMYPEPQEEKVA